jgi:hypothetical protein
MRGKAAASIEIDFHNSFFEGTKLEIICLFHHLGIHNSSSLCPKQNVYFFASSVTSVYEINIRNRLGLIVFLRSSDYCRHIALGSNVFLF